MPKRSVLQLGVLDALRGLAACYVVMYHAGWLLWGPDLWGNEGDYPHRSVYLLWSTLRFGHQAVLLFFLISGFCIHYRQARTLAGQPAARRTGWSFPLNLASYASRRLRRLYPPLLVGLVLTAILDYVGTRVNSSYYSGQSPYESFNTYFSAVSDHAWLTLVGNLGLQASLAFRTFGTDAPLWSLSYEFWFYVLYPIVVLASARYGVRTMLSIAGGVSAIALAVALHEPTWAWDWIPTVLTYWVVWTGGATIAEAYVGRIRLRGLSVMAPVAMLATGLLAVNLLHPVLRLDQLVLDLMWSAALGVLLTWGMLACPTALAAPLQQISRILSPLGNMSFSLYVVHAPLLFLLSAWWLSAHQRLPRGIELAMFGVAAALGLAGVCWFFVERRCVSKRPLVNGLPANSQPLVDSVGTPAPSASAS